MPPTARSARTRRSVLLAVLGVLAGVGVVWGVASLASSGEVDVNLGEDRFDAGETASLAPEVAENGPLLFADASTDRQDRPIYLQHLSAVEDEGWVAFSAVAPGAGAECALRWEAEEREFVDPCDQRRYPADGRGLAQYPVTVEDGELTVDLRRRD